MIERKDNFFTLIQDRDLHDNGFYCAKYAHNDHIDITIHNNAHAHRTISLCAGRCYQWGRRLIAFAHEIITSHPDRAIDYQI
ncbi:hypothetical protein [Prosthecobacter sp.]|uniref:hypothetical protein n=1 Tax=Prosthecobacter sp. TaxID=1965333 RepID=UPI0037838352